MALQGSASLCIGSGDAIGWELCSAAGLCVGSIEAFSLELRCAVALCVALLWTGEAFD